VAESSTTIPEPIVEVLPEGNGKGADGFVRSLKEDFCQPELFLHQSCPVEELTDPRSRDRMAGKDLVCEPRLPDETSQEVGEIAVSVILPPVFEIVYKDKGDVMLIEGSRQGREVFGSLRKKDQGHGEGPQERRLPPCEGTEPCYRKSPEAIGMTEPLFADTLPRLGMAVVEVIPKGVTGGEERVKAFQALHVFHLGKKQSGCVDRQSLVQNSIV
jgi:hypothetical protein